MNESDNLLKVQKEIAQTYHRTKELHQLLLQNSGEALRFDDLCAAHDSLRNAQRELIRAFFKLSMATIPPLPPSAGTKLDAFL